MNSHDFGNLHHLIQPRRHSFRSLQLDDYYLSPFSVADPRVNMSILAQLPASLDTALDLEFVPVIELQADISNFDEWEHSVRFYLDYHGLYGYLDPKFEIRKNLARDSRDGYMYSPARYSSVSHVHRHGLFVYSVIWESAKAVLPRLSKQLSNKLYGNHQHDPKLLFEILHDHRSLHKSQGLKNWKEMIRDEEWEFCKNV